MKKRTKILITILAVVAVLAGGVFATVQTLLPYALTADGETLVLLKNKAEGEAVMKELIESYVPKDTDLQAIILDKDLKIQKLGMEYAFSGKKGLKAKDALESLENMNSSKDAAFNATIRSRMVKKETYTPEIEYHEDNEMLAGQSRVEKEGKDGVRNVTYELTSINGEVKKTEAVGEEVIEKGEQAVIYKGTLGVPEGENWETYEGMPVFNDGDDICVTAKQHLGSPYKYNGRSFVTGIDCVHYVKAIYRMYGIEIPSKHSKIRKVGHGVSYKNAKPGDIICYKHHVAIYVGGGRMAEATPKHGTHVGKVRKGIITIRRVPRH